MSRSCQTATFSRPTSAAARTTRARPQIRSATFGLRLCGIDDEPFMPGCERLLDLAHLGAREVADLEREALERGGAEGERVQQLGVSVAGDDLRRQRIRLEAEALAGDPLDLRLDDDVGADRAGELPDAVRSSARASRPRARSSSNAQPASFQPNVIGSAWIPCDRPMQSVVPVLVCALARPPRARRSIPSRISTPASRIWSESAVSITSDDVRP